MPDSADASASAAPSPDASSAAPILRWQPLSREYGLEYTALANAANIKLTKQHPLLGKANKAAFNFNPTEAQPQQQREEQKSKQEEEKTSIDNPLSPPAAPLDPLSALLSPHSLASSPLATASSSASASSSLLSASSPSRPVTHVVSERFEAWAAKRPRVLHAYTTSAKIAFSAFSAIDEKESTAAIKEVSTAKSRLEELEEQAGVGAGGGGGAERQQLTAKEYAAQVGELKDRLRQAWDAGERVVALKIAIQCAKMLGDVSTASFYPAMYVLLTDILDAFGDMVFERIKAKGVETYQRGVKTVTALPPNFLCSDVCASAKETCQNWVFKTACIRELLPRMYVEMTLLKCYRFLYPVDTLQQHIARIGRMMRGIGDPLIACYARCYLAAKVGDVYMSGHVDVARAGEGRHIPEEYRPVLVDAFVDHLQLLKGVNGVGVKEEYLSLMQPALEYFAQCALYGANKDTFTQLFTMWKEHNNSSLILYHFLSSFDSTLIARHALNLLTLISDASPSTNAVVPPHLLYLVLGQQLLITAPADKHRLSILNEVWKHVTKVEDVKEYLAVAEVWVQYLVRFFSEREINILLKDVIKHARQNDAYKAVPGVQESVARVINSIITLSSDVKRTLTMDSFLLLLDLLDKKSKLLIAKTILSQFSTHGFSTSDPVILHTLFDMSRTLHDSVDSLTFEDERRQIAHLLIAFIRSIDYGRDLEQQLSMYVECRQAFTSLDTVTAELIQRVALLANRAHFLMKGRHSKKTSAFVKAGLAYVHITIPSLDDRFARLRLFLVGAQVALVNHMITQSEALLKAAISLLADVPAYQTVHGVQVSSEETLQSYVRNFTSFLLLFPGHPEHGPFYLVKGLLNAIQACAVWKAESGGSAVGRVRVHLGMLSLFCTYYQKDFPYHIAEVESNDTLYGLSPAYLTELAAFIDSLMSEIMSTLVALSARDDLMARKQSAALCLDFANLLLASMHMDERVGGLVVKLMGMVKRAGQKVVDAAYVRETRRHLQSRKGLIHEEVYNKLVAQELLDGSDGTAAGVVGTAGAAGVKSQATNGRPASAVTNDPFQIRVTAGPSMSSPVNRVKVAGPL